MELESTTRASSENRSLVRRIDFVARWAFAYSIFSALVNLESWADANMYLQKFGNDIQALAARIGEGCALLAQPWEVAKEFVFSIDFLRIPEHWQDASLLSAIVVWSPLTLFLNLFGILAISASYHGSRAYMKLLYDVDRDKPNDAIATELHTYVSSNKLEGASMGPVADYLRALNRNLTDKHLLRRKWRAIEQIGVLFGRAIENGPTQLLELQKNSRHHVMRIAAALILLLIIVLDRIYAGDASGSLSVLWRTALLMLAVVVVPVLIVGTIIVLSLLVVIFLDWVLSLLPWKGASQAMQKLSSEFMYKGFGNIDSAVSSNDAGKKVIQVGSHYWAKLTEDGRSALCLELDVSLSAIRDFFFNGDVLMFRLHDGSVVTTLPEIKLSAEGQQAIAAQKHLFLAFAEDGVLLDWLEVKPKGD